MKKIIAILFLCISTIGFAQKNKTDYSELTTLDIVKLSIKGLDLQNTIWQDSIVKLKELKLIGVDSENFKIIHYTFKTNYKKSLSTDEFYSEVIPETMTTFFKDLENNCKVSFEEIVVKHKENGKEFKIMPLYVFIKT